jgi:hypothetical protein
MPKAYAWRALPVLLAGCVYLPETHSVYNAECGTYEKHTTLTAQQAAPLLSCRGEGCITALAFSGIVAVTSVVVSGSVVIKDNVVRWLERQPNCGAASSNALRPATAGNLPEGPTRQESGGR